MKKSISLLTKQSRFELLSILNDCFPNPKSELDFTNPYELLCAVVLSAQATDESVNKVTPKLFAIAPTPEKMMLLGQVNIANYIKTIGLWRAKSANLEKLSKILVEKFSSIVPDNYADLILLPGVGSKTAKVVLNVAFGQPTIAVDTHIFRVSNRTGFCLGKDAKEVENNIVDLVDDEFKLQAHHLFLLHGRYVCKSRNPMCMNCKLASICKQNGLEK